MTLLVLDSSAVMAILFDEPPASACITRLLDADAPIMSVASALECALVLSRDVSRDRVQELDAFIDQTGVELRPVDLAQYRAARAAFLAYGKGRHPARLNFGDCFAYALAKTIDAPLLFVGDDFRKTDIMAAITP